MNDEQWALEPHAFQLMPEAEIAEAKAAVDYWAEQVKTGACAFPRLAKLKLYHATVRFSKSLRPVPYKERLPWYAKEIEP